VSLEKKSQDLRDKMNKLEIENLRLKGLANLYQEKVNKLEKQKEEILSETKEKAQLYLKDVNKKIEDAIKNIKESQANSPKKQTEPQKKDFKVGDYASINNTSTVGIIEELDQEKNKAVLLVGSLKIKVKLSDLIPAKKSEAEQIYKKSYEANFQTFNYRLDIRGKKYEDAEFEVIKFLDNAMMGNVDRVEILHGKGTGVLKQMTHAILRTHSGVKNFYFAPIESGGDGITIVELK